MGGRARRLLTAKKYDTLVARLVDLLGTDEAAALWMRAELGLNTLLTQFSSLPKGEKPQVEQFVLTTFALYCELTKTFGKDEAFRLVDDYMAEYSANAAKMVESIVALPGGRGLFMRVFGKVLGVAFGKRQGYENDVHECSPTRIAYDVLACPYQRVFSQVGAPELCQLFCRNDEVCYGHLDGITFVRTGTLANGASRCDFLIERTEG